MLPKMPPKWDNLPDWMKSGRARKCYEALKGKRIQLFLKRSLDLAAGLAGCLLLLPLFAAVALYVRAVGRGPVLFRQQRMTAGGRLFTMYKFRTMKNGSGPGVTADNDGRLIAGLLWLRKSRLDELPQLLNLIRGDMSLVGARPELPRYLDGGGEDAAISLLLPAGITGAATLRYQNEGLLLAGQKNPEEYYRAVILPDKLARNRSYVESYSFAKDIRLLLKTAAKLLGGGEPRTGDSAHGLPPLPQDRPA